MSKKNKNRGSSLDDLLVKEGVFEDFQTAAIKEVIAWQLVEEMKAKNITKTAMAKMMHTSRAQLNRLLDPKDQNVTILSLQRAAAAVGKKLTIGLG